MTTSCGGYHPVCTPQGARLGTNGPQPSERGRLGGVVCMTITGKQSVPASPINFCSPSMTNGVPTLLSAAYAWMFRDELWCCVELSRPQIGSWE